MILGLVEYNNGAFSNASLEMLTLAHGVASEQGDSLEAFMVGEGASELAEGLSAYGVSKVHVIEHERLDEYAPDAWAQSVVQLIEAEQPQAVMASATTRGNEVLAHTGARLSLPMAANCSAVRPGEQYGLTRQRLGGSLMEEATLEGEPKILTVAPSAVQIQESPVEGGVAVETFTPSLEDKDFRARVTNREISEAEGISISDAQVVISGGRGVGGPEGFEPLEELAELLDGAVGASRVASDNGWRPHSDQVGQSGTTIAPDLYIACGISGAIQHWVGMQGAKNILAINTNDSAAMVQRADYAIIGDLHEIVPAISEEVRKAKGN